MKLVEKFSISAILLVLSVIIAVSIVLFIYQRNIFINQIQQSYVSQLKALTEVTKESFYLNNDLLLLNYLKQVKENLGAAYAMVIEPKKGEIIAHYDTKYLGKVVTDKSGMKAKSAKSLMTFTYINKQGEFIFELCEPVYIGKLQKGVVRIGLYQNKINKIIEENFIKIGEQVANITLIALILGILGAILLGLRMSRPIKIIAKGVKLIGEGNLDYRINIKSQDEIGSLAKEINNMAIRLQELDQLKNDFVSSVTHELRSPLTAITGYVDYLLAESSLIGTEEKEYLEIIKKNATRLSKFIDDILDVAKIESGQIDIEFSELQIAPVIDEIITLFKPIAEQKKISLEKDINNDLSPVNSNHERVCQILTNLVSNALKFTPENGKITIKAKNDTDHIVVSVSDTGIGIPKNELTKIFDKFHQVKGVREKIVGAKGTGLGLAIVKGLVEALHGKIWVESELNKGTTFYFTLPKLNK